MITDLFDRMIVKTAHVTIACVLQVARFFAYAQMIALLLLGAGVVGFGLYLALSAIFRTTGS